MKILIVGPVCQTGYGVATAHLANEISKIHPETRLLPISAMSTEWARQQVEDTCRRLKTSIDQLRADPPDVVLANWHEGGHPVKQIASEAWLSQCRYVAMPTFELDRVTTQALEGLGRCWRVVTSARWCQDVLVSQGLHNVAAVPFLGVETLTFHHRGKPMDGVGRPFRMLNIGKLEARKGHDLCIRLIDRLIHDEKIEDFELWTLWNNPFLRDIQRTLTNYITANSRDPTRTWSKLRNLGMKPKHDQVADVIRITDLGVYPFRAEGWNLPLLETLACGIHVVAAYNTGPTSFLNENNAGLVRSLAKEPAVDGIWFHGQGNWFVPDFDELVEKVVCKYRLWKSGKLGRNEAGIATGENFTWAKAARRLMDWLVSEWKSSSSTTSPS